MILIAYILWFLSSISTATIVVLLNNWTGWEIHSLSILFIIPIGGILLGMGWASGLFLGRWLTSTKMTKMDIIVAIFLWLITFFGVNYISYQTTYVSVDSENNISLLSQFSQPEDYAPLANLISFEEYMNMINSSSSSQFRFKGAKIGNEFETGATTTTILFYIQIIGVIIGSLGMWWIFSDFKYCDNCKKYFKNKNFKNFDLSDFDSIVEEINKNLKNGVKLKKTIEKIKGRDLNEKTYGDIWVLYCPNCHEWYLVFKFFKILKDEIKEISEMKQQITLEKNVVLELIKK